MPLSCTLVGDCVRAGFPSPAEDHLEQALDLNEYLIRQAEATFFVRVQGDSMREAGILDGDVLVVDKGLTAVHGDIVVAVIDGAFTVKYLRTQPRVALVPANRDYKALYPQDGQELLVWGVVTGVTRKLRP